jgi:hypothetical protein
VNPRAVAALTVLLFGCGPYEGDDPGECTDGADNNRDGLFDCDDEGCLGSPDCVGAEPPTTTTPPPTPETRRRTPRR